MRAVHARAAERRAARGARHTPRAVHARTTETARTHALACGVGKPGGRATSLTRKRSTHALEIHRLDRAARRGRTRHTPHAVHARTTETARTQRKRHGHTPSPPTTRSPKNAGSAGTPGVAFVAAMSVSRLSATTASDESQRAKSSSPSRSGSQQRRGHPPGGYGRSEDVGRWRAVAVGDSPLVSPPHPLPAALRVGGRRQHAAEQQQHVRVVWGSAPRAPGGPCGFRTSITCNFRASERTLL